MGLFLFPLFYRDCSFECVQSNNLTYFSLFHNLSDICMNVYTYIITRNVMPYASPRFEMEFWIFQELFSWLQCPN